MKPRHSKEVPSSPPGWKLPEEGPPSSELPTEPSDEMSLEEIRAAKGKLQEAIENLDKQRLAKLEQQTQERPAWSGLSGRKRW
jgi:hypothetical protein